jgi:hypothetical protein
MPGERLITFTVDENDKILYFKTSWETNEAYWYKEIKPIIENFFEDIKRCEELDAKIKSDVFLHIEGGYYAS